MDSQSSSLINAIFSTTIWAVALLGISSILGSALGWLCGQNFVLAAVSQRIIQFFACWASVAASRTFCPVLVITLFTTIGVQKAKQNGNQWHFAISNAFLGIRFGVILFFTITQSGLSAGLGGFIFKAYNNSDTAGMVWGALSILILVIFFDRALNILEKYIINFVSRSSRA
jgi:ABC-type nitrate/sulfonate/bicarbonate transport system permease component